MWHGTLSPTLAKDVVKGLLEGVFAVLNEKIWGDAISAWCFAAGQAVDRFVKFGEGWFSIQFLHDGYWVVGVKR